MTATEPELFDVGGYRLERPFRVRRLGHIGLNCTLIDESIRCYRDLLGLRISDRLDFSQRVADPAVLDGLGDPGGYFMRHGTEHHSFVLFNRRVHAAINGERILTGPVTINQISWQVGSLREVVEGEAWLRETGNSVQRAGRDMPGSKSAACCCPGRSRSCGSARCGCSSPMSRPPGISTGTRWVCG